MSYFDIHKAIRQLYPNSVFRIDCSVQETSSETQYAAIVWDDIAATAKGTPNPDPRPTLSVLETSWEAYYLPIIKTETKDEINVLRDEDESEQITYGGNPYDANWESYAAISGFAFDNFSEDFIDANNVVHNLEGTDFAAMRTLIRNQRTAARLNATTLKNQVDALETVAAVEAFDINVGW